MSKRIILLLLTLMLCFPGLGMAASISPSMDEPANPILESASFSASEARVGDTITIKAKIIDPSQIVRSVEANITGETAKIIDLTYNSTENLWVGTYQIKEYDHQGKWYLSFYIHHRDGSYQDKYSGQSISVINPKEDRILPVVNNITINPQPVKAGEPFQISAKLSDNYGIRSVWVNFLSPVEGTTRIGPQLTYDSSKDEWTTPYTFDGNMIPGDWKVELRITDLASNVTTATKAFQFSNPNADFTNPTVKSFTVNKQSATHGEELKIQADLSDDNSGIDFAEVRFEYGYSHQYSFYLEKNPANGLWEKTIEVPWYFETGQYEVSINVADKAGNRVFPKITHPLYVFLTAPVVNKVTDHDPTISGKGYPSFGIEVRTADQVLIASTMVDGTGEFWVSIPMQKEGTALSVYTIDRYGKRSGATTVIVEKAKISGWVLSHEKWYYYDPVTFTKKTGWFKVGSAWYYANTDGVMQTGWLKLGTTWYYLTGSGAMKIGWLQQGKTWYYFGGSGAMATGWLKSGTKWYYFYSSGAMATGWVKISGKSYYFYSSGVLK